LKNFVDDLRIKFLASHNVSLRLSNNFFSKILIKSSFSSRLIIQRIIKKIIRIIFNYLTLFIYKRKIKYFAKNFSKNAVFITDHGCSNIYKFLARTAKYYEIKTIGVPHSLVLHTGSIDPNEDKINFTRTIDYNHFDYVIMPNKISNSFHSISKNKLRILGSSRFSKEWVEKLIEIYPNPQVLLKKDKLNVLLFGEKSGPFHAPWLNVEHIKNIVNYLDNNRTINLIIKYHPSMDTNDLYHAKNATIVSSDTEYTTNQLIRVSDVVVATVSSALTDALVMGKMLVIPKYASPFKLIFDEYCPDMVVDNYEEFVLMINNYIKDKNQTYNHKRFYNHIVAPNKLNVLEVYAKFIESLN